MAHLVTALAHQFVAAEDAINTISSLFKVNCICGTQMAITQQQECYGELGVVCDRCHKLAGYLYHCPMGKSSDHLDGSDYCLECGYVIHHKQHEEQQKLAIESEKREIERLQRERKAKFSSLKELIGVKRFDIYDNKKKQWWPCTLKKIKLVDGLISIKVNYDGQARKCREWIQLNVYNRSDRMAEINTHTANHQRHRELSKELTKRKNEWQSPAMLRRNRDLNVSNISCNYYRKCTEIMRKFIVENNINQSMFDSNGNRCFCSECIGQSSPVYPRGEPPQTYILPNGYSRFGIKLLFDQTKDNVMTQYHVVYHGTKTSNVKEISESGLILLKPDDLKLNNNNNYQPRNIKTGHYARKFERINAFTNKRESFDPCQIFTSPSCKYASKYSGVPTDFNGSQISFVFQCRQKPGSYGRGQETMGYGNAPIDKYVRNNEIEFYTKKNLDIHITGILIKIHNFEVPEIHNFQRNGRRQQFVFAAQRREQEKQHIEAEKKKQEQLRVAEQRWERFRVTAEKGIASKRQYISKLQDQSRLSDLYIEHYKPYLERVQCELLAAEEEMEQAQYNIRRARDELQAKEYAHSDNDEWRASLTIGDKLDVYTSKWYIAEVVPCDVRGMKKTNSIMVHYVGYSATDVEEIPRDSDRIAMLNTHTSPN